jgi:hypothetical protein
MFFLIFRGSSDEKNIGVFLPVIAKLGWFNIFSWVFLVIFFPCFSLVSRVWYLYLQELTLASLFC